MNLFKKVSLSLLGVIGLVSITSCGKFDKTKDYLDITSSCELSLDYEGKSFFNDGISKVNIIKLTDGDTTTFGLPNDTDKTSIVVRYDAINTPESTASVEKWGKSASKYNANRLENAYEVVVESVLDSDGKPSYESNGRYMAYVWYRNSATDTFKNLNLELVENGYAKKYGVAVDKYKDYFTKAENFAKEHELRVWGNDDDPLFSDDPYKVTIEELVKDLASDDPFYYSVEDEYGARIQFEATVLDHWISGSSNYYTFGSVGSDGILYSMDCFGGYDNAPLQGFLGIGNTYKLTAAVSKYNDNYQISGVEYVIGKNEDTNASLISEGSYYIFDSTHKRIDVKYDLGLNTDLVVSSASLENATLTIVGSTYDKASKSDKEFTIIINNVSEYDVNSLSNKSISCKGFVNNYTITLADVSEITVR